MAESSEEETVVTQEIVCDLMKAVGLDSLLEVQVEFGIRIATGVNAGRRELWSELSSAAGQWVRAMYPAQEAGLMLSYADGTTLSPLFSRLGTKGSTEQLMRDLEAKDGIVQTGVITLLSAGQQNFLSTLREVLRRRYPFPSRPKLFSLPPSYTQLHSQLTTISGYSFPALCLICGAVMDANGKGKCAAHSRNCSKDGGIMFLLQVSLLDFLSCVNPAYLLQSKRVSSPSLPPSLYFSPTYYSPRIINDTNMSSVNCTIHSITGLYGAPVYWTTMLLLPHSLC